MLPKMLPHCDSIFFASLRDSNFFANFLSSSCKMSNKSIIFINYSIVK